MTMVWQQETARGISGDIACVQGGTYSEYVVVDSDRVVKVPSKIPVKLAGAVMTQGNTAHYLTTTTYAIQVRLCVFLRVNLQ